MLFGLLSVCLPQMNSMRLLVSDFLSRVGTGEPNTIVFHLPGKVGSMHDQSSEISLRIALSYWLKKILKKYILYDSLKITDVMSQTLRGILSTERGEQALSSIGSCEKSLIESHAIVG